MLRLDRRGLAGNMTVRAEGSGLKDLENGIELTLVIAQVLIGS
jgi:hypothetical protein